MAWLDEAGAVRGVDALINDGTPLETVYEHTCDCLARGFLLWSPVANLIAPHPTVVVVMSAATEALKPLIDRLQGREGGET